MATDFEQQEDPEYLQELQGTRSRRQLEEEVRTLQEELHLFRSGSLASYSPSRVSFAVETPPREAQDTTVAATAELLNHMRKNSMMCLPRKVQHDPEED